MVSPKLKVHCVFNINMLTWKNEMVKIIDVSTDVVSQISTLYRHSFQSTTIKTRALWNNSFGIRLFVSL